MVLYIASAIVGLGFGFGVGYLKYLALWRKIMNTDCGISSGGLYARLGIGYAANIASLFTVFLTRNMFSFNFMITIIATGVGLSVAGKLAPIGKIVEQIREES